MVYYLGPLNMGLRSVKSLGDGYSIQLKWFQAFPTDKLNSIAYNIYYSTIEEQVFSETPKFVSTDGYLCATILDLIPGQLYHFAIRAVEYNPSLVAVNQLPIAFSNLMVYPESLLRSNIGATDTVIPLLSSETFPQYGIVQVGVELINYTTNDLINSNLDVPRPGSNNNAHLVLQSNNQYYLPGNSNIGKGSVANLVLVNGNAPTENWTIKCIEVLRDNFNNPIPSTARFSAIGSVSGNALDIYGNGTIWIANGAVLSNGIISFSITETSPTFLPGDYFTVQVMGFQPGLNGGRGFLNTQARMHDTDGYDGYLTWNSIVRYVLGDEELNTIIFPCQSRFDINHDAFTVADGYKQWTEDYLTTNLAASDAANVGFATYDYAGWRRTDPVLLLSGGCVNSYFGGAQFCADGYDGVGRMVRGLSFQERNNQRQEYLLSMTGEPVCLIKRVWTGIPCNCYLPSSEFPDDRCPNCYGTKFRVGWEQYANPRRSDGRIMVRFSPTDDDLKPYEAGLESEHTSDVWTLTVPTVKDRDFIVRFDEEDNEEYRYEVLYVNRNRTLTRLEGAQKFRVQRVRKFDPIYTVPVLRNNQYIPRELTTSITNAFGIGPHLHTFQANENSPTMTGQLTGISSGHNHPISWSGGQWIVQPVLGHTHTIVIPPPINPPFSYNPNH
jgi:hypothetical protein